MRPVTKAVLAVLLAAAATSAAAADPEDLLPPAPVLDDVEDAEATLYLRGDVGYVHHKRPEADFAAFPRSGSLAGEGIADTAALGFGIGYRLDPMFRMDVTFDHRFESRFDGRAAAPDFAAALLADRGRFRSSTAMLNAYADLGTWNGLTPYVGAGIGIARNEVSRLTRATFDGAMDLTSWGRIAGGADYGLAWALMAGLGYELLPGLTLDLGYRYVSLGEVKTRRFGLGNGVDLEAIGGHEVRVGVRFGLN
ncbi:outer membrane protein [Microvirga sp. GCM10011540]|uniref:outer membrane protein n=1 Tax=Microvirga sp. GCM10011540 TaxID=3317338 RepID=UPI00361751F4